MEKKPVLDRRKFVRIEVPLNIRIIDKQNRIDETVTKNISPLGLRFQTKSEEMAVGDELEITIQIPRALSPVHTKAAVVWKKKLSTEDSAPYDLGCKFATIEEDNKNTFLKYFCDLLYEQASEIGKKGE